MRWNGRDDSLERALRDGRPEPRDELVGALARAANGPSDRRWSRVAFASALTVFMVGFFASFGGLGYASSNVESVTRSVTRVVVPAKQTKMPVRKVQSAAQDQYGSQQVYTPPAAPKAKPKVIQVAGISTSQQPTSTSSGTLPFTGFGLGLTAGLGLLLVALGVIMRRRESRAR